MRNHLDDPQRMESLARRARYRVSRMAALLHVSTRWFEYLFLRRYGQTPRTWLRALKLREAQALLRQGEMMKAIAIDLGYAYPSNFSREFSAPLAARRKTLLRLRKRIALRPSTNRTPRRTLPL